jgi:hypothetical protein
MQKTIIRKLITHYGYRWTLLKHNVRNSDEKLITLHDRLILSNLVPGSVACWDQIGFQYQGIINQLVINASCDNRYNNLIMTNHPGFKYQTLDEIKDIINNTVKKNLQAHGRLFVSFNYQFVKFNRLKFNFAQQLDQMTTQVNSRLVYKLTKALPQTNPYGDCFFVFESY